jgi:hypothetical protein
MLPHWGQKAIKQNDTRDRIANFHIHVVVGILRRSYDKAEGQRR